MVGAKRITVLVLTAVLATIGLSFTLSSLDDRGLSTACAVSNPPPDLQLPAVSPALSKGDQAPEFNATDIDGNPVHLSDLRGRVVVINFMGSWCQSCVWEASRLVELYNTYRDRGVAMLSISVEPDGSIENLQEFRSKYCLEWTIILDDGDFMALYEVVNLPTTYVIDQTGRIVYGRVGLIEVSDVAPEIDQLLR